MTAHRRCLPSFRPALPPTFLLALALSGCGPDRAVNSAATVAPPPTPTATTTGWVGRADVGRAIELAEAGKVDDARSVLRTVLARQPNDAVAADLLQQIDGDPVALLGKASFPYTVRTGDALSTLAGHFLGNPTRFYALGRYNSLTFPVELHAGQTLRIPGVARAAARPAPARKAAPAVAAAKPGPAAAPKADPERAARLRAAALEQLNRGAINRAILLLRQADQAAPGNPLVQRDLDRALRIQKAVQTRG